MPTMRMYANTTNKNKFFMKFKYIAIQPNGRRMQGEIDVPSEKEVLAFIANKGWKPIVVEPVSLFDFLRNTAIFGGSISILDQMFLSRYLALMLRVGANLSQVIDVLIADFEKPEIKAFLGEVRDSLEGGQPLYASFAKYPQFFSPVFVNLVKAGERSGNLETIFEELATDLAREREFRGRIVSALVYPLFLLIIASLVLLFLVIFAIPRLAGFFISTNVTPPLFSRIVFAVGGFLNTHLIVFGASGVVLCAALVYFFRFTDAGRRALLWFFAALPIVSSLYQKISLQQFAATLSSLMKAGLPILESLRITADVVTYPGMTEAIRRVATEGVARGAGLGASFKKEPVFPIIVTSLISISEKSGRIEDVLATFASFYESEVDIAMKRTVSFLEPAMLLLIGGLVGSIALAVILPIYQLVGQF